MLLALGVVLFAIASVYYLAVRAQLVSGGESASVVVLVLTALVSSILSACTVGIAVLLLGPLLIAVLAHSKVLPLFGLPPFSVLSLRQLMETPDRLAAELGRRAFLLKLQPNRKMTFQAELASTVGDPALQPAAWYIRLLRAADDCNWPSWAVMCLPGTLSYEERPCEQQHLMYLWVEMLTVIPDTYRPKVRQMLCHDQIVVVSIEDRHTLALINVAVSHMNAVRLELPDTDPRKIRAAARAELPCVAEVARQLYGESAVRVFATYQRELLARDNLVVMGR